MPLLTAAPVEKKPVVVCLHCEREPAATGLGLCPKCNAIGGVPCLYVPRKDRPWWWESHLRRLTRRASLELPLFEENDS